MTQVKTKAKEPTNVVELQSGLIGRAFHGDYAKWRPVFDKHKPLRDKAGLTNVRVYCDADNPTEVIVWGETSDVAKAREALGGQEIRSAMHEAGVVGPPRVHVIP